MNVEHVNKHTNSLLVANAKPSERQEEESQNLKLQGMWLPLLTESNREKAG